MASAQPDMRAIEGRGEGRGEERKRERGRREGGGGRGEEGR